MWDNDKLIEQLNKDSKEAFTQLYNEYAEPLYKFAYRYLMDKELAEDAVQNTFMKVWDRRHRIDKSKNIKSFLFTITKNDLLNMLRSKNRLVRVLEVNDVEDASNEYLEQEEQEIYERRMQQLREAMQELPPQKRRIFALKLSGKYSNDEIAKLLNLSTNTIKYQYSQSLKKIRELLTQCLLLLFW